MEIVYLSCIQFPQLEKVTTRDPGWCIKRYILRTALSILDCQSVKNVQEQYQFGVRVVSDSHSLDWLSPGRRMATRRAMFKTALQKNNVQPCTQFSPCSEKRSCNARERSDKGFQCRKPCSNTSANAHWQKLPARVHEYPRKVPQVHMGYIRCTAWIQLQRLIGVQSGKATKDNIWTRAAHHAFIHSNITALLIRSAQLQNDAYSRWTWVSPAPWGTRRFHIGHNPDSEIGRKWIKVLIFTWTFWFQGKTSFVVLVALVQ